MNRVISGERVSTPSGGLPERRSFEGTLVRLEPLDPDRHSQSLYSVSHGTEEAKRIWTFLPHGPYDDFASYDKWAWQAAVATDQLFFAIRDRRTDQIGGMASYLDIHHDMGSIEIGYIWFAPILQRTRQATEALFLMLCYAFEDLKYRRVAWRCNSLNEKSRAAALRLGFTFEGIFYQHMVIKGCNRDTAWYSMLDHEWPTIRQSFEHWLAPSNFDSDGRQLSSLQSVRVEVVQKSHAMDPA